MTNNDATMQALSTMLANNPVLQRMAQQAMSLQPPAPPPPQLNMASQPVSALPAPTAEQFSAMLEAEFRRWMPQLHNTMAKFEEVFKAALPPEDYDAFTKYAQSGSPGFAEMALGGKFNPLAQLFWETVKENIK